MRNLMLACACLAIISSAVSINLWHKLRTERALTAEPRATLTESGQRGLAPMATLPPASQTATATTSAASAPPATMAMQAVPVTNVSNFASSQQEMLKDPEYRKARLAQLRLSLPQTYPGLIEALGLSPDEADKLWNLLAEDQLQASANAIPVVNGQIDTEAMREMSRTRAQAQRKLNDSLTAMLGDSRFQQWKDYQETRPERQRAAQLNRTMESMGLALSDAQMRPLTAALIAEQKRQREDMSAQLRSSGAAPPDQAQLQEENLGREAESNRRIIDAAAPVLSERQLETLRATLDQQLTMKRATSRLLRERVDSQLSPFNAR